MLSLFCHGSGIGDESVRASLFASIGEIERYGLSQQQREKVLETVLLCFPYPPGTTVTLWPTPVV